MLSVATVITYCSCVDQRVTYGVVVMTHACKHLPSSVRGSLRHVRTCTYSVLHGQWTSSAQLRGHAWTHPVAMTTVRCALVRTKNFCPLGSSTGLYSAVVASTWFWQMTTEVMMRAHGLAQWPAVSHCRTSPERFSRSRAPTFTMTFVEQHICMHGGPVSRKSKSYCTMMEKNLRFHFNLERGC
jgi:hypothetical protein